MTLPLHIKDGFSGERAVVLPEACIHSLMDHPLSRILYITDIGFYPSAEGHFRIRSNPICEYVFIYCIDGAGWYSIGNTRHIVNADSYFILPPGVPHSYGADSNNPWTIYWIHFNGDLASHYLPSTTKPISIKPGVYSRIAERLDIFEEIIANLECRFDMENLLYACSIFHHFLGSLRFINKFRHTPDTYSPKQSSPVDIVEAAIHYMNENISKRLTVEDIARYAGYSPTRFTALFRAKTNMAPIAYLNNLKIESACRLLLHTNLKINHICHKVGIHDQYYFSRLFSKIKGVSPAQYRNTRPSDHDPINLSGLI